jgi:hypothetical protein
VPETVDTEHIHGCRLTGKKEFVHLKMAIGLKYVVYVYMYNRENKM